MYNDPFDAAANPQIAANEYFGKVEINAYFCVLEKGVGKVEFTEAVHDVKDRRTAIDLEIIPIEEYGASYTIKRNILDISRDWQEITLPSLRDLGLIDLRALNGMWAKVGFENTGRSYTNKNGTSVDATCFKFLVLYQNEQDCRNAYIAEYGVGTKGNGNGNGNGPQATTSVQKPAVTPPATNPKDTALKFAKAIVDSTVAGKTNLDEITAALAVKLAEFPIVGNVLSVDSPEINQMILEAMSK
jgi:hypothetical protein